jgi:hypothetical protein
MPTARRVKRVIPAEHRSWLTRHQRHMLGLTVVFFQLSLIALSLLPLHSVVTPEWVTVVGGTVAILGIFTHVSLSVGLPGDRWVYLICVVLDFYVWGWFVLTNYTSSSVAYIPVSMLLFATALLSFLAHMLDGGARAPRDEP